LIGAFRKVLKICCFGVTPRLGDEVTKKVLMILLVACSALFGCQDQDHSTANTAIEAKAQLPAWVGNYQGTTPCMGCFSSCDDCPGMAVALCLHDDRTFTLSRESLSGHNPIDPITGPIRFQDDTQQKIELLNVDTRNLVRSEEHTSELQSRENIVC